MKTNLARIRIPADLISFASERAAGIFRRSFKLIFAALVVMALLAALPGPNPDQVRAASHYPGQFPGQGETAAILTNPLALKPYMLGLTGHLGGEVRVIEVKGSTAYAGIGPEFVVLDLTDPAQPKRLGYVTMPGEVLDFAIEGDLAYVSYCADNFGGQLPLGPAGLRIVDLRQPAAPAVLGDCHFDKLALSIVSIAVKGRHAFVGLSSFSHYGGITMPSGAYLYSSHSMYPFPNRRYCWIRLPVIPAGSGT